MLGYGTAVSKHYKIMENQGFSNEQSLDGNSGSSMFNITGYNGISPGSDWAFSCWVKIPIGDTSTFYFFQASTVGDNGQFRLDTSGAGGGNIIFQRIYTLPSLTRDQVWLNNSNAVIRDGNWHHLMAISNGYDYTNTDLEFYIDGVLSSISLRNEATSGDGPWSMNAGGTTIFPNPNNFTSGSAIDEVAVWSSAVPSVASVYNGGCPGNLNNLANPPDHWFRFEGNTNDSGSAGDTPTLGGTVSYLTDKPC